MHRLDGNLVSVLGNIGCEQTLLDQEVYQRRALWRDFRAAGNTAAWAARVGINASEPWNETSPEECETRLPVARDLRVGIRRLKGTLDSGLDRALDPAKLLIFRELEIAVAAFFAIEPLQGEGQQRQRILGPAFLDLRKQRIDKGLLDREGPLGPFQPPCRTLDHLCITTLWHWTEIERNLA